MKKQGYLGIPVPAGLLLLLILSGAAVGSETMASTDDKSIALLLRGSVEVFTRIRTPEGAWLDVYRFDGKPGQVCSIANYGPGLISLCIADAKAWNPRAKDQALQSLRLLNGDGSYRIDRSDNGFFSHYFDAASGHGVNWRGEKIPRRSAEFSTIDTALMMAGALFCANYFKDPELLRETQRLWDSVDWEDALADSETCRIKLSMQHDGMSTHGQTSPFNEYLLVAGYIHAHKGNAPDTLFSFYPRLSDCPRNPEFNLVTDQPAHVLSSFTILFPYYLCPGVLEDADYNQWMRRWAAAEKSHWKTWDRSAWGSGAGMAIHSYHPDSLTRNPYRIISPHIMAGFYPVDPSARESLLNLLEQPRGRYWIGPYPVLWRFSLKHPKWKASVINGIDFSTMLYGLAAMDPALGLDFFRQHRNPPSRTLR